MAFPRAQANRRPAGRTHPEHRQQHDDRHAGGLLEGDELVYQIEELFSPDARPTAAMQR